MIGIEDFLPKYPDINPEIKVDFNPYEGSFYDNIYRKKEFFSEKLTERDQIVKGKGVLMKHQKIIARFLSSYTPYNGLLLMHEMGTGKTCAAIGAIEQIKSENNGFNGAMVFAKSQDLIEGFIYQLMNDCTDGRYIPDVSTYVKRPRKLYKDFYDFYTFGSFTNIITNITSDLKNNSLIKQNYSNKIIIIDEIHNIREPDKDVKNIYTAFKYFLHNVDNCKILLMSGTPMKNDAGEIASIMNLILPQNQELQQSEITELCRTKSKTLVNKLKEAFKGRVSYLKAEKTNQVEKIFEGELYNNLEHIKVVIDNMSEYQSRIYTQAYQKDSKSNKDKVHSSSSFYINSKDASLFVYPEFNRDGSIKEDSGLYGKDGYDEYISYDKGNYVLDKRIKRLFEPAIDEEEKLMILHKYSSKYAKTIRNILKSQGKLVFVYSDSVKGSGCILFSLLLELFGYKKAVGNEKVPGLRYALLTGESRNDRLINRINKEDNKYGDITQVIIGSAVLSEGVTLKNIQVEEIMTPSWNYATLEQVISRGIRYGSHSDLLEVSRPVKVKIYQRISLPALNYGDEVIVRGLLHTTEFNGIRAKVLSYDAAEDLYKIEVRKGKILELTRDKLLCLPVQSEKRLNTCFCINLHMYETSERKDVDIKYIEYLIKTSSFDCQLTYNRNRVKDGIDGSRECDYEDCAYECDGISEINPEILDDSTYNLYYSQVDEIINLITMKFRTEFKIDLSDKIFDTYDRFEIMSSVRKLINQNSQIYNKYGIKSYIKEHNNILFLSNNIHNDEYSPSAYYVEYPALKSYKVYNKDENLLSQIVNDICSGDSSSIPDNMKRLPVDIQEMLFETSYIHRDNSKNPKNTQAVIDYFKKQLLRVDDNIIISTVGGTPRCFEDDKWKDCSEELIQQEKNKTKKEMDRILLQAEQKTGGYYGFINIDGDFQIVKPSLQGDDLRAVNRGMRCISYKNAMLNKIISELGIKKEGKVLCDSIRKHFAANEVLFVIDNTIKDNAVSEWRKDIQQQKK